MPRLTKTKTKNSRALDKLLKKKGPVADALRREVPPSTLRDHANGTRRPTGELQYVYAAYGLPWHEWLTAKELRHAETAVDLDAIVAEQNGRAEGGTS